MKACHIGLFCDFTFFVRGLKLSYVYYNVKSTTGTKAGAKAVAGLFAKRIL